MCHLGKKYKKIICLIISVFMLFGCALKPNNVYADQMYGSSTGTGDKYVDALVRAFFGDQSSGSIYNINCDENGIPKVPYINQGAGVYELEEPHTLSHTELPSAKFPDGINTIAAAGCGYCSTAMALSYIKSTLILPTEFINNGEYVSGQGSKHTVGVNTAKSYGVSTRVTQSINEAYEELQKGNLVMAIEQAGSVEGLPGGHWTTEGHFILLIGVLSDGTIAVNDSASIARTYWMNGKKGYTKEQVSKRCIGFPSYTIFVVPDEMKEQRMSYTKSGETYLGMDVYTAKTAYQIDVTTFLERCKGVTDWARNHHYKYGSSNSYPPCTDGWISCDRLVCSALYSLGMTDQPAGGIGVGSLDKWLGKHGFVRSTSFKDMRRGSIMLVWHQSDTTTPGHAYVCASNPDGKHNADRYDCGQQRYIDAVQPIRKPGYWYRTDKVVIYNIPEHKYNSIFGTETTTEKGRAIVKATSSVKSPGYGYCAKWVSQVYQAAGYGYPTGNADDMYYRLPALTWSEVNSRKGLQPGMAVAINRCNGGADAQRYGHIGIYIGNGKVRDNVNPAGQTVREIDLSTWIKTLCPSGVIPRWGYLN